MDKVSRGEGTKRNEGEEGNWDASTKADLFAGWASFAQVVKYIDGVRHVKKIAECADATSTFTRICIEHLL